MAEPVRGVCALVLAAGQGSRYREQSGEDKLLAPGADAPGARPLLAMTLASLEGVAERLVVVTRDDNLDLLAWLEQKCAQFGAEILTVRTNGLGHSLAQAIRHCPTEKGWLVALGDMPYVRSDTARRVAAAIEPASVLVPTCEGRRGHPRGIGRNHAEMLLTLDGDRGAQALFAGNLCIEISCDDPGVLVDIDRPGDRRPG